MNLPSVDEVNATRLSRFDDGITAALQEGEKIEFFRDVVRHYVEEHDIPEVDVAAALAAVLHGEEPLLLEPEPEKPAYDDRRGRRDRDDRGSGARRETGTSRHTGQPLATYKIQVGKRHRVEPRQIVGAIANEGGLRRADFGNISIRNDFSLVELPADLAPETWKALESTRISGKLIELSEDSGGPVRRSGGRFDKSGPRHGGRGDSNDRPRKPRQKRKFD